MQEKGLSNNEFKFKFDKTVYTSFTKSKTKTKNSNSESDTSSSKDSMSDEIKIKLSHRKSQILTRKMTPKLEKTKSQMDNFKQSNTMTVIPSKQRHVLLTQKQNPGISGRPTRMFNHSEMTDKRFDFDPEKLRQFSSRQGLDLENLQIQMKRSRPSSRRRESRKKKIKKAETEDFDFENADMNQYCDRDEILKLLNKKEFRFNTYITGSYLGDEEILDKTTRIYNCVARTDVELMVLTKADFEFYLLQDFPHLYEKIVKNSKEKSAFNEKAVKKLFKSLQASANFHDLDIKKVRVVWLLYCMDFDTGCEC